VGPRAGLNRCGKSLPHRNSIPGPSCQQPVAIPTELPGPWNSKQNSPIGKQQPDVFLQVQKLKEEAELVSWQMQWMMLDSTVNNEEN
jgi:hypothetical protein